MNLIGKYCYVGLDLASNSDFNAASFLFPPQTAGDLPLLTRYFWIPEDKANQRIKDNPDFKTWEDEGYLCVTPGNVTAHEYIRIFFSKVREIGIDIRAIAFDPAYALFLIPHLIEDGFVCEKYVQSLMAIGPMAKEIEKMIMSGEIVHDGNPVSRWMYGNVELYFGPNDLYRPIKDPKKREKKIDGVIADIMALGQWRTDEAAPKTKSYLLEEDSELLTW